MMVQARRGACGADQKARHFLDRLLRRRQSDARQRPAGERLQTLERERQMRAALVAGNGVNFIDDHGAAGRQHLPAGFEPSRMYSDSGVVTTICGARAPHARTLRLRVSPVRTTARISTSGRPSAASSARMPSSGASRLRWMSFDKRLQRRHVHDARLIGQRPAIPP